MSFLLRSCAAGLRAAPRFSAPVASVVNPLCRAASTQAQSIAKKKAADKSLFKRYKPINNSLRHLKRAINDHLYPGRPLRGLTYAKRKKGGRGGNGRITVRFVGGGHKRRIRMVDYVRLERGFQDVVRIEYDPNRSAHLALIKSRNPDSIQPYSYILAPDGLRAGDVVASFRKGVPKGILPDFAEEKKDPNANRHSQVAAASSRSLAVSILRQITVQPGNVVPLKLIPPGTLIHNICLRLNGPGQLVRAAGTFAQVITHQEVGQYTLVKLQSGEVRKINQSCCATIGKVSNPLHNQENLGKAGRNRWLGRRPHVRGVAQNAVDHPHGGGRGKSKGGKHPVSPWGWLTKGKRTRKPGPLGPRGNNKMVVQDRPRGKEKREAEGEAT